MKAVGMPACMKWCPPGSLQPTTLPAVSFGGLPVPGSPRNSLEMDSASLWPHSLLL
jgi:hypothetical protein